MTHVDSEVSLSRLELVVLARLSSAKPPGPKDLGEAVSTLVLPAESPARSRQRALEVITELWQRGLVADRPAPKRKTSTKASSKTTRARAGRALVAPRKPGRRLSDEGRRALCRAFGLETPPTWIKIRDAHLPALGFGLAPGSEDARRRLESGDAIVAATLQSELGIDDANTVTALCDALIIEALDLPPGEVTLQRIRAHVLARRIGVDTKGEVAQIAARAVSARLGAHNAHKASLARALARRWASQPADNSGAPVEPAAAPRVASGPAPQAAATLLTSPASTGAQSSLRTMTPAAPLSTRPADPSLTPDAGRSYASTSVAVATLAPSLATAAPLQTANRPAATTPLPPRGAPDAIPPVSAVLSAEALLAMIREAIPAIGADGRHGPDKVFVSALWHRISHDARLLDYTLDRFKHWLVTANRDRLLDLARADLVGAMDPRQVAESEIEDLGATFHFVLDRRVFSLDSDRRSHAR